MDWTDLFNGIGGMGADGLTMANPVVPPQPDFSQRFNAAFPNRVASKHAHSQRNAEKDWGKNTLDAVRFAFYVINEERAARNSDGTAKVEYKPDNTIVIALRAALDDW